MRRLVVSMNITLDGYCAGPDGKLDWHFNSWTKEMGNALCDQLAKADTILLGRVTYTAMAHYWPSKATDPYCRSEDFAFANMMNCYTKIVFSKTLSPVVWRNTKWIKGNLHNELSRLKKKPGRDIMVYGSCQLVDGLIISGLVDEYQLWIHPVILGGGTPLFKHMQDRFCLKMVNAQTFSSGVVLVQYQSV